jgi:hypothetical protein
MGHFDPRDLSHHLIRGGIDDRDGITAASASHVRSSSNRKHTTVREHMPSSHRRYADWTPERLRLQAGEMGRNTSALVEIILRERTHRLAILPGNEPEHASKEQHGEAYHAENASAGREREHDRRCRWQS